MAAAQSLSRAQLLSAYVALLEREGRADELATVEFRHRWTGTLYAPNPKRLDAETFGYEEEYGFPMRAVAAILNEIAADGWRVVDVSEDRRVASDDGGRAIVTRARFLLTRS